MRPLLALLAAAAGALAADGISLQVGDLATAPYLHHQAVVTLTNAGAQPVAVRVEWHVKPPAESPRHDAAGVTVPAGGSAEVRLDYELFDAGDHAVTVVAQAGGQEAAKWEGTLTVPPVSELPLLFPNYYAQQLTVVGPRAVVDLHGSGGAAPDRHLLREGVGIGPWGISEALAATPPQLVPGSGAHLVRAGEAALPVRVVPRSAGEPLYGVNSANQRLTHRGRPWYPLGIYLTPSSRRAAGELAEAGFDLVSCMAMPAAPLKRYLDEMQAAGLRVWVPVGGLMAFDQGDAEAKRAQLKEMVDGVGRHPALALWESWDEPAWNGLLADGLYEGYQYLRGLDPNRPIWTNHAPRNTVPTLAWYNRATDLAGCDIYPVPMPQTQSNLPNKTLAVVGDETRKSVATVYGEKPVLMVLQGFAWRNLSTPNDPQAVFPTFAESRFMAYDAVVNGASGLLWWGVNYTPRPSPFWSDLKALVSELDTLRPMLAAAPVGPDQAPAVEQPAAGVRADRRIWQDRSFVLVVNETGEPVTARLRVPGSERARWRALFNDPAPRQQGAAVTADLPAWGVAVLTTHPTLNPRRKDFAAEARDVQPAPAMPREEGNLLDNPSFELDANGDDLPDGWQANYPFLTQRDPAVHRGGEASLRLESESAGLRPLAVQHNRPTEGGKRYRLTGWVRSDTPGVKARLYVEWVVGGQYFGKVLPWMEPTAEWTQQTVEFETTPDPKGNLYAVVQIDGPGRAWWDDVRLEAVP